MTNTEIFKALRQSRGLSHRDIARRVGISESQSRNIESGESAPSVHTALKIATLLRTRVSVLWQPEAA